MKVHRFRVELNKLEVRNSRGTIVLPDLETNLRYIHHAKYGIGATESNNWGWENDYWSRIGAAAENNWGWV